jgi:hypothetical protein
MSRHRTTQSAVGLLRHRKQSRAYEKTSSSRQQCYFPSILSAAFSRMLDSYMGWRTSAETVGSAEELR